MDRKGTNELISGEKSFIAILPNLRVYFVVRLPDYYTPCRNARLLKFCHIINLKINAIES